MKNIILSICVSLLMFINCVSVSAKDVSGGEEFQVHTNTTDNQCAPSIVGSDNNFAVVWTNYGGQDGNSTGVFGQVFGVSGITANKVGSELQVNTYTVGNQEGFYIGKTVAKLSNGNFVAVWGSEGQDGSGYGVYGQIIDSIGFKVGDEFQINTHTTNHQWNPVIAGLSNGNFIVAWQSLDQDGQFHGVYGQIFNSTGSEIDSEFLVNTHFFDNQYYPCVAALNDSGFVIVWTSTGQDGDDWGSYGQIFSSVGTKVGDEFRVNAYTAGKQIARDVVALNDENFVVVWSGSGQDGDSEDVYGQIFNVIGNKVGDEFKINTYTLNVQRYPSVTVLDSGNFIVAWESDQDGSGRGIYGQLFDKFANKIGGEFPVNTCINDHQNVSSVAALGDNKFVASWASNGQDGDGSGVYGRIFESNAIPTIKSITKTGSKNTPLSFSAEDFTDAFSDADGDSMTQIQVMSLPNNGNLKISTSGSVSENQVIAADDLDDLVFDPDNNFIGKTSFAWKGFDGLQYSNTTEEVLIKMQEDWFNTWWGKDLVIAGTGAAVVGVIGIPFTVAAYLAKKHLPGACKKCCCKGKVETGGATKLEDV